MERDTIFYLLNSVENRRDFIPGTIVEETSDDVAIRLTRKGLALYPVLMSLGHWGDEWMDGGEGAPLEYVHQGCGKRTHAVITCSECGELLRPEEVETRLGPGIKHIAALLENEGIRNPEIQSLLNHPG